MSVEVRAACLHVPLRGKLNDVKSVLHSKGTYNVVVFAQCKFNTIRVPVFFFQVGYRVRNARSGRVIVRQLVDLFGLRPRFHGFHVACVVCDCILFGRYALLHDFGVVVCSLRGRCLHGACLITARQKYKSRTVVECQTSLRPKFLQILVRRLARGVPTGCQLFNRCEYLTALHVDFFAAHIHHGGSFGGL